MKNKSAFAIRSLCGLLFLCLVWSIWAQAQTETNAPAGPEPNTQTASAESADASIWLTFGLDQVPFLNSRYLAGIPLWQYLASLIYIFLAFFISKFLDQFIRNRVQKWAAKTSTRLDDLFVELVRGPVKIVTFVILLHIGMKIYDWPDTLAVFFSKTLKIIVACSLTYVALKAIDLLMGVWHQRATTPENEQFSKQLLPLLRKTFKVFVVVIAALVTSQNLGLNVTGLIASLSIGGLAIGLAAQDTLGNLFGAVAILTDKPFRVGDRIQLDAVDGTVESIGFRSTTVRNLNGHLVSVPNKTMGNATITNVSKRPNIKTEMNIGVTYDTPAEKVAQAMQILEEVFKPHPMTADLIISFNKFESSSLNILVVHWWNATDMKAYLAGIQLLNLEVKRRFDAEGISFAFPTQTLYLKQDSAWQLKAPPAIEDAAPR
ncbi:MAG TPA: mechanosensitive ion channel family protein [Methylomirabilota bacterium]|nr:mechanosensitive ion channel family protein [Methylomirabilota bacterium]